MSSEASGGELLTTVAEGLLTSLGQSPLALDTARRLLGEAELDEEGARERLREIVAGDGSCGSCGASAAAGSCGNCGWVAEADTAAETVAVLEKPRKRPRRRRKKAKVAEASQLEEYAVVNGTPTAWGGVTPAVAAAAARPALVASAPPNLRESDPDAWENCGNCVFYGKGQCNLYGLGRAGGSPDIVHRGGWPVDEDDLCDSHSTLTPGQARLDEARAALKEAVASGGGDAVARARARVDKLEEFFGVRAPWNEAKHPRRGGKFAPSLRAVSKLGPGQRHFVAPGVSVTNDQEHGYSVQHHGEVLSRHGRDVTAAVNEAHRVAQRDESRRAMPAGKRRARRDAALGLRHAEGGAARIRAQLEEVKSDAYPGLDRSPKENWVDKAGGLPRYIERIAKHLHYEKGKDIGHAIAIAVNVVKKMCAAGDTNFPGKQSVNPKSRAEACAAVAQWEKKKGSAAAKRAGKALSHGADPFEGLDFATALALTEADYRPIPPSLNFVRKLHDEIARKDGPQWPVGYALLDEADELQAANPDSEVYYDVAEARLDIRAPKLSPGKWSPLKHPRVAKGRKGGGEFASVLGGLERAARGRRNQPIPGALDPDSEAVRKGTPHMLGIYHKGQIKTPEEIEPGHPIWFSAPRHAKAAGKKFLGRHKDAEGFEVTKVGVGGGSHYRTVHSEFRDDGRHNQPVSDDHQPFLDQMNGKKGATPAANQPHLPGMAIPEARPPLRGRLNQPTGGDQGALAIDHAIGSVLQSHGDELKDWHVSGPQPVNGEKTWVLTVELKDGGKHTINVSEDGEVTDASAPAKPHAAHAAAAQKAASSSIHDLVPTGEQESPYHMPNGQFYKGADGLIYEKIESGPGLMMGKKGPLAGVHVKNHSHGTEKDIPAFAVHGKYYDLLGTSAEAVNPPPHHVPSPHASEDVFELLTKSVEKSGGNGAVGSLSGKNVVVTGKIPGHTREQFHAKLAAAGAHPQSSVTKTTDYLITGENVGKTKTNAATAKGVKVVPHHSVLHLLEARPSAEDRLVAVRIALEEAVGGEETARLRARERRLEEGLFSEVLHPRDAKGRKGGGRFRAAVGRLAEPSPGLPEAEGISRGARVVTTSRAPSSPGTSGGGTEGVVEAIRPDRMGGHVYVVRTGEGRLNLFRQQIKTLDETDAGRLAETRAALREATSTGEVVRLRARERVLVGRLEATTSV